MDLMDTTASPVTDINFMSVTGLAVIFIGFVGLVYNNVIHSQIIHGVKHLGTFTMHNVPLHYARCILSMHLKAAAFICIHT